MVNNYRAADILHFKRYIFTDTGASAEHFALILLPSAIMDFEHNLLCSVITSRVPRYLSNAWKLLKTNYNCFSVDSYACLDRRDTNSVHDLSPRQQPVGKLIDHDIRKVFKILKRILYGSRDTFYVAVIVREWKKIK